MRVKLECTGGVPYVNTAGEGQIATIARDHKLERVSMACENTAAESAVAEGFASRASTDTSELELSRTVTVTVTLAD
eukprot:1477369-Rhodomonas_salina.2